MLADAKAPLNFGTKSGTNFGVFIEAIINELTAPEQNQIIYSVIERVIEERMRNKSVYLKNIESIEQSNMELMNMFDKLKK